MAIKDLSQNQIAPGGTSGDMLGFIPVDNGEALGLDMYRFLVEEIRLADAQDGNLFVKRFLDGPQQIWNENQARIFAVKNIWSINDCPDDLLQYLKNIVGWTSRYDAITSRLDAVGLRRLIANSAAFWKGRGTETSIANILNLLTGARLRIINWFDTRWLLGEGAIDEERLGLDITLISSPLEAAMDEYRTNIRIVDNGTLDRVVVTEVLRLTRPVGERFEVTFLSFLDQFEIDGDNFQWAVNTGAFTVAAGLASLAAGSQTAEVVVPGAGDWTDVLSYWRVRGTGTFGAVFHKTVGSANGYYVGLTLATSTVTLIRQPGAVVIASVDTRTLLHPFTLDDGWHGIRVHAALELSVQRITIYVDGEAVLQVVDVTYTNGTLGLYAAAASTLECDEVEMGQMPVDNEIIDINS